MRRVRKFFVDLWIVFRGMWRVAPFNVAAMVVLSIALVVLSPIIGLCVVGGMLIVMGAHAQASGKAQAAIDRERMMQDGTHE